MSKKNPFLTAAENTTTTETLKMAILAKLLASTVYTKNSGLVIRLEKQLRRLSLHDLRDLLTVTETRPNSK